MPHLETGRETETERDLSIACAFNGRFNNLIDPPFQDTVNLTHKWSETEQAGEQAKEKDEVEGRRNHSTSHEWEWMREEKKEERKRKESKRSRTKAAPVH